MGGACSTHGGKRNVYRILVANPERKGPVERSRRRYRDNIKTDLEEVAFGLNCFRIGTSGVPL
jgi:hypothetical protein